MLPECSTDKWMEGKRKVKGILRDKMARVGVHDTAVANEVGRGIGKTF